MSQISLTLSVVLMQPDVPLRVEQIKFLASVYGSFWMGKKKKQQQRIKKKQQNKTLDCKFNHQNHPWCCEMLTALQSIAGTEIIRAISRLPCTLGPKFTEWNWEQNHLHQLY